MVDYRKYALQLLESSNVKAGFQSRNIGRRLSRATFIGLYEPIASFHAFLIFSFALNTSKVLAACFFPDGTDANIFHPHDVYLPCISGDPTSMCCALNRTRAPDKCRSDGLCLSTWDSNLWRESCSDYSWKSPKCIKLCSNRTGVYAEGDDVVNLAGRDSTVTICGDGTYCCGNGTIAKSCCDKQQGVYLLSNGEVSPNNPSATASVPLNNATSTPNSSPPPTVPSSLDSKTRIIIGTIVGIVGLIVMVVILILVRRIRKLQKANQSQVKRLFGKEMVAEVSGDSERKEMDGVGRLELPGSTSVSASELHG